MRLIAAFFRMVRFPNLIFIALTQLLFHQCVLHPILEQAGKRPLLDGWLFIFLIAASVMIAAAGYIINDYFDINIDEVNKPHKNVVDHIVSRRWAMLWHFILSAIGILLSIYVPCCPADAVNEIKEAVLYISPLPGGEACVRDVIEKVLKLNDHWHYKANVASR